MKYKILNDKKKPIAKFINENDRNDCLRKFQEDFPDCEFTSEDEE